MYAKFEKPCTRRVKEPRLPPEVPSENTFKRRYVSPIINVLKKLCFGRQSRHGRKDNIEILEKTMQDAGWDVKQRHAFGGMVLYVPPMPDLNFEDTDSEEEESSSEEESESEEESDGEESDGEDGDEEEDDEMDVDGEDVDGEKEDENGEEAEEEDEEEEEEDEDDSDDENGEASIRSSKQHYSKCTRMM